jgi:hypothetical protein
MQKRIVVASCCAIFFFAGWAFGQSQITHDASAWTELGKADGLARLMYVKGYIQGYADGDSAMEKIAAVLMKSTPVDASTKKFIQPQAVRVADVTGFGKNENITVGKIDNAVSFFYGDYRNAPVCWNQAVLFSIWALNGNAPTDQEVDAARKSGAESGCKL